MQSDKTSHKFPTVALLVIAGIIGFLIFVTQHRTAFPAASIDLKLGKPELLKIAHTWAEQVGYKKEKLIESIDFDLDDEAKVFLEYNLGGAAANELMRTRIPVWYWECRFCREYEEEQVSTWIEPNGKLAGVRYHVPNDKALPSINHDEARKLALAFVHDQAHESSDRWHSVEDTVVEQVHRKDHHFVWEDDSAEWSGAKLRTEVVVAGNLVTQYNRFLHVPEVWERKYKTMRSYNQLLGNIASGLAMVFIAWLAYCFLRDCALHKIRWRFALISATFAAVISCANSFNELPAAIHSYEPTTSFSNFLLDYSVRALLSGAGTLLGMIAVFGAGESTYRNLFGKHMALEWLFRRAGWQSPEFTRNIILGYALFGVGLGYQILYYLFGKHLGYWCPLEVGNFQTLSGQVPALSAVSTGVSASTLEELIFRVIGLSLAQRIFKNFWIANLVQAAVWGFCHSSYPQQPAFARGVELTAAGILSGWVLKMFGLPALLIEHYTFDAFLEAEPLFHSPNFWDAFSALAATLSIALFGVICFLYRSKSSSEGDQPTLRNEDIAPREIAEQPQTPHLLPEKKYVPLSKAVRILLGAAAVSYIVLIHQPAPRILEDAPALKIDRTRAIEIASRYLTSLHFDLRNRKIAAECWDGLSSERTDLQYVYQNVGMAKTNLLAQETVRPFLWRVRFFRPLDPEEFSVDLDGQGQIMSPGVHEQEDSPGAKLSKEQAQAIAEKFLRTMHPEFLPFTLADSSEEKLKNRTDYSFEFAVPRLKVADAEYRLQLSVIGDKPSGFGYYWHVPDKWKFENSKKTTWNTIASLLMAVGSFAIAVAALWWAYGLIRGMRLPWRVAILLGIAYALLHLMLDLNYLPVSDMNYRTTTPWANYLTNLTVGYAGSTAMAFLQCTLVAVFGLPAARLVLGGWPLLSTVRKVFAPDGVDERRQQLSIWIDATVLSFGAVGIFHLVSMASDFAWSKFGYSILLQSFTYTSGVANAYSGSFSCLNASTSKTMMMILGLPVICAIYQKYCRNFLYFLVVIVFFAICTSGSSVHFQDSILSAVSGVVNLSLTWVFVTRLAKQNIAAYIVYSWITVPLSYLYALGRYGQPLLTTDYFWCMAILAAPLLYLLYIQIHWRYAAKQAKTAGAA